jgi:hypothetical protein
VGGGWRTILGPALQEIGAVAIEMSEEQPAAEGGLHTGILIGREGGQRLPCLFLTPAKNPNDEVVIWLTDRGKAGLLDEENKPIAALRQLLDAGYAVAGVDLIGQGEFVTDGDHIEQTRLHARGQQPWQTAACYTFGYNRPLFAQRVRDVLAMIAAAKMNEHPATKAHLVGIGREAGLVALAARFQAGDAIARTAAYTGGFRFDKVSRVDDPMFVPGAVRYDGVMGLRKLAGNDLQFDDGELTDDLQALSIVDWLSQQ